MIDNVTVDAAQSALNVRFNNHVKVSTLVDENFSLLVDSATPTVIPNAFNEIDCDNYNSITRVLRISIAADLDVDTTYILRIDGVQYAGSNQDITQDYEFALTESITGVGEVDPQPVQIEDFSIKSFSTLDFDTTGGGSDPDTFSLVSTDPEDADFYVEEDYGNGLLTLTFSSNPDPSFLTSSYIKVQRKKVQVAPTRWETVPVKFSISSTEPLVYLSFPAIEDDEVYREDGYTYFETGYTYRVRLSRYIKAA